MKLINVNEADFKTRYDFCLRLSHATCTAYAIPTTRIVSCKSNLQHPFDSRKQQKKMSQDFETFLKNSTAMVATIF